MKNKFVLCTILALLCITAQQCSRRPIYRADPKANFCITGPTCDWMHEMLGSYPDRKIALADICLPGAHDAAMYITQHCTPFANSGNTQTQYLPMKQQLEAGIRIFDMRPWYEDGLFYSHHSTHCDGLGCKGDMVINMLRAVRAFVDTHDELVILELTHYCHTGEQDSAFLTLLTTTLGDRIYREAVPAALPLIQRPLREVIPMDSAKGKVLLLLESAAKTPENKAKGFFNTDELHSAGGWTNDNIYDSLCAHQVDNFIKYSGNGSSMYEWAWQITQHDAQALRCAFSPNAPTAIRKGAHHANGLLPGVFDSLIAAGVIHRGKIPNILWSDMVDTMVVHQCMRLTGIGVGGK